MESNRDGIILFSWDESHRESLHFLEGLNCLVRLLSTWCSISGIEMSKKIWLVCQWMVEICICLWWYDKQYKHLQARNVRLIRFVLTFKNTCICSCTIFQWNFIHFPYPLVPDERRPLGERRVTPRRQPITGPHKDWNNHSHSHLRTIWSWQ